jgi:hypothetical protein
MSNHAAELIRDRPQSCLCIFEWDPLLRRHVLKWATFGCPWHSGGKLWEG